jgi:ferredoxin
MNQTRQLRVIADRCLGCRACATVCPAGLITRTDTDHRREVRFATLCAEECDRCVAACPTQAIDLAAATGLTNRETVLEFAMVACEGCDAPLAPAEMLAHLRAAVPVQVQTDAGGQRWLRLCPACRQQGEARQMAREALLARWSR